MSLMFQIKEVFAYLSVHFIELYSSKNSLELSLFTKI